ncbi:MAG: threonine aldolase [Firmicutes bacterium]|nr:threonine aldolase [Bacillota bacterium]
MIFFRSDYSQGAHPDVMEALIKTNLEHSDGYGLDAHCENAAAMIRDLIGKPDASVHMMVGGTPCNITLIAAALRPYEGVVAPRTAHCYFHETGGVEATGHRVIAMEGINGKLNPELIDRAWDEYEDEHTVVPRMVYISQPTEGGSLYSKAEMLAISEKCRERDMYLYIDGARLGTGLTSPACDFTIRDVAGLCDAFYIGGTKNGALFGEALVINNPAIDDHFRWMIKQNCGLLAKGRLIGVQFEALLAGGEDSIYFRMARHSNEMASKLRAGLEELGLPFYSESPTNQIFPILPTPVVEKLEEEFFFYRWAPEKDGMIPVRFVTAWGTEEKEVDALLARIRELV